MLVCPNCNKNFDDGYRFCDTCGTELREAVFFAGNRVEAATEELFDKDLRETFFEDGRSSGEVSGRGGKAKKVILFTAISLFIIAAVALVLLLFSLLFGRSGRVVSYGLYIKENEIFYSNLEKDSTPLQITSKLFVDGFEEEYGEDFKEDLSVYIGNTLSNITGVSTNGSRLVFPDKLSYDSDGISLYSMTIDGKESNAEKIGSDIDMELVAMSEDLNIITYVTDYEGSLYQYNVEQDEKTKIAVDVEGITASKDGKIVYYTNDEGSVYVKCAGEDKKKITGENSKVVFISEDYSTVYILWEESLYRYKVGKEKEKIASDVCHVIKVYESGEIYYLAEENTIKSDLWNYVFDDYRNSDATLSYPDEPDKPKSYQYDSDAEYYAAYELYEEIYKDYEEAVESYREKEKRDDLRALIDNEYNSISLYSLCYYDGTEAITITDSCNNLPEAANDSPVIMYRTDNDEESGRVKLSDFSNISDIKTAAQSARSSSYYLAKEGYTVHEVAMTGTLRFQLNDAGTVASYIIPYKDNHLSGDLYKINIKGNDVSQPEHYDTDVYYSYLEFFRQDQLVYYKDELNALYINGKEVAVDVDEDTICISPELNGVLFVTEEKDEDRFSLNLFRNDAVIKISDDISGWTVTPDGKILYLYDYNRQYYKGELRVWDNGKNYKIDDDVICIIWISGLKRNAM